MSEKDEFWWNAMYQAKRLGLEIGLAVGYVEYEDPYGYTFKIEIPNIDFEDNITIGRSLFYSMWRYGFTIAREEIKFSDGLLSCAFYVQNSGGIVVINCRVLSIEEVRAFVRGIVFVKGEDVSE